MSDAEVVEMLVAEHTTPSERLNFLTEWQRLMLDVTPDEDESLPMFLRRQAE